MPRSACGIAECRRDIHASRRQDAFSEPLHHRPEGDRVHAERCGRSVSAIERRHLFQRLLAAMNRPSARAVVCRESSNSG